MKRFCFVIVLMLLLTACTSKTPVMVEYTNEPSAQTTLAPTQQPATPMSTTPPTSIPTPTATLAPVVIDGTSYQYDTRSIDLSDFGGSAEELFALSALTELERIELGRISLSIAEVAELKKSIPATQINWVFTLAGREVSTSDTQVDLTKCRITDLDELKAGLTLFYNSPLIDFSDCSLTNEQLDILRQGTQTAKIVWTVRFKKWKVRTDAVAFSTWQDDPPQVPLSSGDVDCIRYCTELVALDLGHNNIRDISFLEPLTNLKILILSDNKIEDISVLAGLDKLMYIELFLNHIEDLSPLSNKDMLLDLNLCYNHFTSIEPILTCPNLERIWICMNNLTEEQEQQLRSSFTNAEFDFTSTSCTNLGWREHPRFKALKEMLKKNIVLAPFD
ncbi:MAG: leucine-rich repeat domain-containing protein [Eubacteriales bacterium]|nr:leucine-rich repeat domain-containing protein [Eubacteriales bacterium]